MNYSNASAEYLRSYPSPINYQALAEFLIETEEKAFANNPLTIFWFLFRAWIFQLLQENRARQQYYFQRPS